MIFISGVHGVGKSYFCDMVKKSTGFESYSASTLITNKKHTGFAMIMIRRWYLFQLLYSEEQRYFRLLFSICFISSTMHSLRQISFMAIDFWLLMVLIYIFQIFPMIMVLITVPMIFQKAIIWCISTLYMTYWTDDIWTLYCRTAVVKMNTLLL